MPSLAGATRNVPRAVLVPGLGAEPGDLVMPRLHGVSVLSDTGVLYIDVNTVHKLCEVFGNSVHAEEFDGYAYETYVGAAYQVGWPRL